MHGLAEESEKNKDNRNDFQSNPVEFIQSEKPFNEFKENDTLIYTAFPHLFPLGKGLGRIHHFPRIVWFIS